jgi:iron complex outermembrane receptor protein
MCCLNSKLLTFLLSLFFIFTVSAYAADENEVKSLDELVIEAPMAELRDTFNDFMPIPTSKIKVDRSEIDTINTISIEDTVRYIPNTEVRRRYIGDANGVIAMRGNGNFQTARHMLFVDGFPLHSFLRTRFNGAPQWNFVSPDETDHVDITFGPFSPKYSGNAMGGVIDISTRQPEGEEWALQTTGWVQDWEVFESNGTAPGYKTFFSYGNKHDNLSYYMFYNRLETQTQPTDIQVDNSIAAGSGTAVTGATRFIDPQVRDSIAFSDDGEENHINDLLKLKMNYDLSPQFKLRGMIGFLDRHRDQLNVNNYLRNAAGNKVWSGTVNFGGQDFQISESNFKVRKQDKQDLLAGLGVSGRIGDGWVYDAALSSYSILQDDARQSDENPDSPSFAGSPSGRLTKLSHSGWQLLELRFDKDAYLNRSELSFEGGYHYDHARLELKQYNTTDWENSESDSEDTTFRNSSGGHTDTHAIHGNIGWEFSSKWDLQVGARAEFWRAFEGFKHESDIETTSNTPRSEQALSPKISLGYKPQKDWDLRFSLARSTRFPLVEELFENLDTTDDVSASNPALDPEVGNHATIMIGHFRPKATTKINLFYDEIENTIFRDIDIANNVNTNTFVNIDKVRTFGAELILNRRDFMLPKHDFNFNMSYTNAEIRQHNGNPSTAGNDLPRVPHWRAKWQSVYHILDNLDGMVAARYQSKSFGQIENNDILDGDGALSEYFFMDLKTTYRHKHLNASLGINNLTDEQAFVGPHPFPNRTYSVDFKWKFM